MTHHFQTRCGLAVLFAALWLTPQGTDNAVAQGASPNVIWQAVDTLASPPAAQSQIRPKHFKVFALNADALRSTLEAAAA